MFIKPQINYLFYIILLLNVNQFLFGYSLIIFEKKDSIQYFDGKKINGKKLIKNTFQTFKQNEIENLECGKLFEQKGDLNKKIKHLEILFISKLNQEHIVKLEFFNIVNNLPFLPILKGEVFLKWHKSGLNKFDIEKLNLTIPPNGIFISLQLISNAQNNEPEYELALSYNTLGKMFVKYKNEMNWNNKVDYGKVDKLLYQRLFLCEPMIFIKTK